MTIQTRTALKIFDVSLTALDACDARVHARTPADAKRIAIRSWLDGDDITAFMADDDAWDIRELIPSLA
jgi:hypothetical protein